MVYSAVTSLFFKPDPKPIKTERKLKDQPEWIACLKYGFYRASEKKADDKDHLSRLVANVSTAANNILNRRLK
jgi:hypothetical protein